MQLRTARLCLDCEEVHDQQQCPQCASETFAYMTRWVPVPERAVKRPTAPVELASPEALGAYREMLQPDPSRRGKWRTIGGGALGLAIFGLAGLAWRRSGRSGPGSTGDSSDNGAEGQHEP